MSVKVLLANHWLVTYRGGEKVLAEFRLLFPNAPLAALICKRGEIPDWILDGGSPNRCLKMKPCASEQDHRDGHAASGKAAIITSPLQLLPSSWKYYKALLPIHPWAFGFLTVPKGTRLVLSSDASMLKGLKMPEGTRQVCFCHSPPRYLWDLQDDYTDGLGWFKRKVFNWSAPRARAFDRAAAQRVDRFIANSCFVAERIKRSYGREAAVIYPPVAVDDFSPDQPSEDFYLLVTQLTPYKRADLAVQAFTQLGKKLIVIGEGSEWDALQKLAGPTVQLLGRQPFKVVKDHFERCRAFLYPQVEDFGITAVEAQAAGKPVIAFRAGGALETVKEGETGLFFNEQTAGSLADAVGRFEKDFLVEESSLGGNSKSAKTNAQQIVNHQLVPSIRVACRTNAERFRPERFRAELKAFLETHYPDLFAEYKWPL